MIPSTTADRPEQRWFFGSKHTDFRERAAMQKSSKKQETAE